ncbi:MAG: AAA family ATPase, partial [Bacilli bacterium]
MLNQINIRNFAIIKETTIDFKAGLTIITGATGAGKSIVIDAINQLLGARSNSNMIGSYDSFAYIEGVFTLTKSIEALLELEYIELEDDFLMISKVIKNDGKSQIKINNRIVRVDVIKKIAPLLVEIHAQDATYYL